MHEDKSVVTNEGPLKAHTSTLIWSYILIVWMFGWGGRA